MIQNYKFNKFDLSKKPTLRQDMSILGFQLICSIWKFLALQQALRFMFLDILIGKMKCFIWQEWIFCSVGKVPAVHGTISPQHS